MDPHRVMNQRQVAAALQRSPDWFGRHWRKLVQVHGLPAPLPGPGHKRWSSQEINAWISLTDNTSTDESRRDLLARRASQIAMELSQ